MLSPLEGTDSTVRSARPSRTFIGGRSRVESSTSRAFRTGFPLGDAAPELPLHTTTTLLRRDTAHGRRRHSARCVCGLSAVEFGSEFVAGTHAPTTWHEAGLIAPEDVARLRIDYFFRRDVEVRAHGIADRIVLVVEIPLPVGFAVLLVEKVTINAVVDLGVELLGVGGDLPPVRVPLLSDLPDARAGFELRRQV